jgi:hypothetical protein
MLEGQCSFRVLCRLWRAILFYRPKSTFLTKQDKQARARGANETHAVSVGLFVTACQVANPRGRRNMLLMQCTREGLKVLETWTGVQWGTRQACVPAVAPMDPGPQRCTSLSTHIIH